VLIILFLPLLEIYAEPLTQKEVIQCLTINKKVLTKNCLAKFEMIGSNENIAFEAACKDEIAKLCTKKRTEEEKSVITKIIDYGEFITLKKGEVATIGIYVPNVTKPAKTTSYLNFFDFYGGRNPAEKTYEDYQVDLTAQEIAEANAEIKKNTVEQNMQYIATENPPPELVDLIIKDVGRRAQENPLPKLNASAISSDSEVSPYNAPKNYDDFLKQTQAGRVYGDDYKKLQEQKKSDSSVGSVGSSGIAAGTAAGGESDSGSGSGSGELRLKSNEQGGTASVRNNSKGASGASIVEGDFDRMDPSNAAGTSVAEEDKKKDEYVVQLRCIFDSKGSTIKVLAPSSFAFDSGLSIGEKFPVKKGEYSKKSFKGRILGDITKAKSKALLRLLNTGPAEVTIVCNFEKL